MAVVVAVAVVAKAAPADEPARVRCSVVAEFDVRVVQVAADSPGVELGDTTVRHSATPRVGHRLKSAGCYLAAAGLAGRAVACCRLWACR